MNAYEARYFDGTNRYDRNFYTGKVKASNIVEAATKAQQVADRKGLQVAGIKLVIVD